MPVGRAIPPPSGGVTCAANSVARVDVRRYGAPMLRCTGCLILLGGPFILIAAAVAFIAIAGIAAAIALVAGFFAIVFTIIAALIGQTDE